MCLCILSGLSVTSEHLKVLITGASGFIGSRVINRIMATRDWRLFAVQHRSRTKLPNSVKVFSDCDLTDGDSLEGKLSGIDVIVHLAGRAHVLKESSSDPLSEFRRVNVHASGILARQAVTAHAKRFIFVSSIGVNGNQTSDRPFSYRDEPEPMDDYAQSKLEAEYELSDALRDSSTALTIVRPPLVYGPSAPGNFGHLVRLVAMGVPLPLGLIENARSFVYLDNLVDLLMRCIEDKSAVNEVFLVSDGQDVSTPEFVRQLAAAMNKKCWLIPIPLAVLRVSARLFGRLPDLRRLTGSLQIDIRHTCETLDWRPPFSMTEGIMRTVAKQ